MDFDNLAACIKQAAKIREEPYKIKEFSTIADIYGEYKYSISEAVNKTHFNKQTKTLANLLLFSAWNDALSWADTQIHPAEMCFVEACYTVCNAFGFRDAKDLSDAEQSMLSKDFKKAAEDMRRSIY